MKTWWTEMLRSLRRAIMPDDQLDRASFDLAEELRQFQRVLADRE